LTLKTCSGLTSLGLLPAALVKLVCDESRNLSQLDGMQACHQLEVISVQSCPILKDLGTPPASVREIDARGCMNLTSLKGLEGCPGLALVAIPTSILDMRALKALPAITVSFDINELEKPKAKGQLVALPESLIQAINKLPAVRLQIKGPSGSWYGSRDVDLNVFTQFKSVISLSFTEFDFYCKLEELTWLVPMENLQSLIFYPRGNMSHVLNGGVFDSASKVKSLQLKVCKEAKINPPQHITN
jgi:hypothetical protein